jgi:hypothetical protein
MRWEQRDCESKRLCARIPTRIMHLPCERLHRLSQWKTIVTNKALEVQPGELSSVAAASCSGLETAPRSSTSSQPCYASMAVKPIAQSARSDVGYAELTSADQERCNNSDESINDVGATTAKSTNLVN